MAAFVHDLTGIVVASPRLWNPSISKLLGELHVWLVRAHPNIS